MILHIIYSLRPVIVDVPTARIACCLFKPPVGNIMYFRPEGVPVSLKLLEASLADAENPVSNSASKV